MSDEAGELVFVYGTLRRGGSNSFRMDGAEFVSAGKVTGMLYVISWYPGLVLDRGPDETVNGDLFRVRPEQLAALDEFEGISANEIEGAEYRRVKAPVVIEECEVVPAWVYEWKGPVDEQRRIPSGDWLFHQLGEPKPLFTLLSTIPLWGMFGFVVFLSSGFIDSVPDSIVPLVLWSFGAGIPAVAIVFAMLGEKRRESLLWMRRFFASISIVWLVILFVYFCF
jgi:gamma-glutamylcyclotransferase (GGCT)/AIG2-like uncharacterized protein YtfP